MLLQIIIIKNQFISGLEFGYILNIIAQQCSKVSALVKHMGGEWDSAQVPHFSASFCLLNRLSKYR